MSEDVLVELRQRCSQIELDYKLVVIVLEGSSLEEQLPVLERCETRQSHLRSPGRTSPVSATWIAHEYFRIEIKRVLESVKRDLPPPRAGDRTPAPEPATADGPIGSSLRAPLAFRFRPELLGRRLP